MTEDNPIYSFPKLKSCLERKGIVVGKAETYKTVKPGDITIENGKLVGDVSLDETGMFVVEDATGVKRNVFLIKKSFFFQYNGRVSIPKAHLCLCDAITNHGQGAFRYANEQPVSVIDRATGKNREVDDLELCGYCSGMLRGEFKSIQTIEDFVEILRKTGDFSSAEDVEVDYAGYVKSWSAISQAYREVKQYRCEKCGVDLSDFGGKLYCQVHHVNGNKLDNRESNLQCLCVSCHSQVDDRHKQNFSTKAQKQFLWDFGNYKQSHSSSDDPEDTETKNNLKS